MHIHTRTTNYHSSKCRLPPTTTHTTTHVQHHISFQPTHKTGKDTTHLTTSTLAPKSSHAHQQYKHTLTHQTNNNQFNKTIHTKTKQLPQHTSHKIHHKHNQTNTLKLQHTTIPILNIAIVSHLIPQLFHKQINPAIMNLLTQHSNQST